MVSDKGVAFIASFEGLRLSAYPDPATGAEPITIGYGHTGGVLLGDTCTEEEALAWLKQDCATAEECIADHVDVDLNQNQYDALVSFIFNCGCGNFRASTMLKLINSGQMDAASKQFGRWNKGNGKVMAGLTRRREAEAELFEEPT